MGDGPGQVLFLPWHLYLAFPFTDGRVIANPAPTSFRRSVISGDNVEAVGIQTTSASPRSAFLERLFAQGPRTHDFGSLVAPLGVKYVVLAKTADWRSYSWVSAQPDLHARHGLAQPRGLAQHRLRRRGPIQRPEGHSADLTGRLRRRPRPTGLGVPRCALPAGLGARWPVGAPVAAGHHPVPGRSQWRDRPVHSVGLDSPWVHHLGWGVRAAMRAGRERSHPRPTAPSIQEPRCRPDGRRATELWHSIARLATPSRYSATLSRYLPGATGPQAKEALDDLL